MIDIHSFAAGQWIAPAMPRQIASAVTGQPVATIGGAAPDAQAMLDHARGTGGPALRAMGIHDRARMVKALALYLNDRREPLYTLSHMTGATLADARIDVDGGIGTALVIASKGRREMPDGDVYLDGGLEMLSRQGSFVGQHICTPLQGCAVHINAFNFPVWGMLEKLAPTLLAGVPAIVKPASDTAYVAEAAFRMIIESGILPAGAVQLISGPTGDLLDRLGPQDVVSFTGSADTALKLRANPPILSRGTRFLAEQDSLNASILGPDVTPDTPEFAIFIKEAAREMTAKAGQKCTAIRRMIVPEPQVDAVIDALSDRLATTPIGDPAHADTRMGALAGLGQRADVVDRAARIGAEARLVHDGAEALRNADVDTEQGAFMAPQLFHCADPDSARAVHEVEAFGPVATLFPYQDADHAAALANRGGGSLVTSLITHDTEAARRIALGVAAHHGRIYINDRVAAAEATGHGSPLPHMVHGGPGRAGGGEELGGVRGVLHYMQRTAVQGSPDMISAITGIWAPGSSRKPADPHPFTRTFHDLAIGDSITTDARTVTLDDIAHFAHFTGDTFYAHMDEDAAAANPFFPGRVAHGYLLLSFAAGLFVEPSPGPVLANTGLNNLAFLKPVSPGDSIRATLTVRRKTRRTDEYGEVRWDVTLHNQDDEQVATYELLTMVAYEYPQP